jgi:hypothetical protein
MSSETEPDSEIPHPPADQRGTDAGDSCRQKTDFHRGVLSANRTALGTPHAPGKKASLPQWADSLGLLLNLGSKDNLGVFDAHDKNLVRAGQDLIPFDVIPCHPAGGFLAFIQETLAAGRSLRAVRASKTSRR